MNIIIIGDIMIDVNYNSEITRNAPEADIPIYNILNNNYILGGAGNVACNLKNLGANIELLGLIGNDMCGKIIKDILDSKQIRNKLFVDDKRPTTQKNRIFLNNKLNVRFDIEDKDDISMEFENHIIDYVFNIKCVDGIIISDYDKGFITERLCQTIIGYANNNNIPTFVDPKIKNYLKYKNCFLFKPNIIESEKISQHKNLDIIIDTIKNNVNCKNLLITRGKEGMILNSTLNKIEHDSIINLVDVTGAGDIVLSVIVYYFLKENDLLKACKVANYVAGKSVGIVGNYNVSQADIDEYFYNNRCDTSCNIYNSKIISDYEIDKIKNISKKYSNIVFTNGCFDILHSAHIELLKFSKSQGNILVVGLNSDDSIKRLKGKDRPVNGVEERSKILSLFDFIDYVIIFDDSTPLNVIENLKPSTIVKGSDYKKDEIVGANMVNSVILFNYINGKSSTNVINKIKNI